MKNVLHQFFAVCDRFLTFRLPDGMLKFSHDDSELPMLRGLLPVFGAFLAMLVCIPFYAVDRLVPDKFCGFAALLIPFMLDVYTGFQTHRDLADYVSGRRRGQTQAEALSDSSSVRTKKFSVPYVFLLLLRAGTCMLLARTGNLFGIAFAVTGAWFARAEVATSRRSNGSEFIPASAKYKNLHRMTGGILMFLIAMHAGFFAPVFGFLIAWGTGAYASNLCQEEAPEMNGRIFRLTGAVAEILLLIFCVLVYVH